jgi:hypothetical protein
VETDRALFEQAREGGCRWIHGSALVDDRPPDFATFFHQDLMSRTGAKEIIRVGPVSMRVGVILVDFLIITALPESKKRRAEKGR